MERIAMRNQGISEDDIEKKLGKPPHIPASTLKRENGSLYVKVERHAANYDEARAILKEKLEASLERGKNNRPRGIKGKGIIAPNYNIEVFIMPKSKDSMTSGKHINASVDKEAHLTAAALTDDLWRASSPLPSEPDKFSSERNKSIISIRRRQAELEVGATPMW